MKSLIVASALALTLAADSKYYIGNYTAGTTKKPVAYPLDTCVPNGAFFYNYVVYHCTSADMKIYAEVYDMDDPYCESEYTTTAEWDLSMTGAGNLNYADCVGDRNYMEVFQYLTDCDDWESGEEPLAVTVISTDACTYQRTDAATGYPIYAKTSCDGDKQVSKVYVGDYTCTSPAALYQTITTEIGCSYFTTTSQGDVYSAMSRCVLNDVVQRCSAPISAYTTHLQFWGLSNETNLQSVYERMFPYAGLDITEMTGMAPNVNITLDLTFCTEWEDRKYGPIVKNVGQQTLDALNYDAMICYMCVDSMCVNSTVCDASNCVMTEQCAPTTTTSEVTTTSSVGAIYVSIFTILMTLLASLF
jgi:hypothetical protein